MRGTLLTPCPSIGSARVSEPTPAPGGRGRQFAEQMWATDRLLTMAHVLLPVICCSVFRSRAIISHIHLIDGAHGQGMLTYGRNADVGADACRIDLSSSLGLGLDGASERCGSPRPGRRAAPKGTRPWWSVSVGEGQGLGRASCNSTVHGTDRKRYVLVVTLPRVVVAGRAGRCR